MRIVLIVVILGITGCRSAQHTSAMDWEWVDGNAVWSAKSLYTELTCELGAIIFDSPKDWDEFKDGILAHSRTGSRGEIIVSGMSITDALNKEPRQHGWKYHKVISYTSPGFASTYSPVNNRSHYFTVFGRNDGASIFGAFSLCDWAVSQGRFTYSLQGIERLKSADNNSNKVWRTTDFTTLSPNDACLRMIDSGQSSPIVLLFTLTEHI